MTALGLAAANQFSEVVRVLLEAGAKPSAIPEVRGLPGRVLVGIGVWMMAGPRDVAGVRLAGEPRVG